MEAHIMADSQGTGKGSSTNKVVIIGAGLSGLAMGIQLKRLLGHVNFEIYESLDTVGGTWAQNTYPNLSCDVPSEYYSYSFHQNPGWTEKYASQPEILKYVNDVVKHYDLAPHIRLQHECKAIRWSETSRRWNVTLYNHAYASESEVQAQFVVTAMGVLNVPKGLEDLAVLQDFNGSIFHTSQWRDIDFTDKRVMVVGHGCSANQVIPWILTEQSPKCVVQIVRSAQWIAPKPNHKIGKFKQWCLRYIPFFMKIRRLWAAYQLDHGFAIYYKTPSAVAARLKIAEQIKAYMRDVANPKFHNVLIPDYDFGAKRPVMDHGYLKATNLPNFELIRCDGIQAVEGPTKRILVDTAGGRHETDIVIMANGFKTQDLLVPMEVFGRNGHNLKDVWAKRSGSEAYMGVSVHDFPNLFLLTGPNTLPSSNSSLQGIECSVIYITRVLKRLFGSSDKSHISIEPSGDAEKMFNDKIQEDIGKLIYTKEVSSWYINKETGKNTLIWPGTQFSFWWSRCVKPVRWQDWIIGR